MDISDGVRENHSKAGHDYQIIKQPKTYEQQVELIKEKGFIVNNDTECISFLKQANYYRLSAYFLPFRKKNGTYLNICIESAIYDELTKFCNEAGQTKTVAVERALVEYFENYKKKQEMLRTLEVSNGRSDRF